MDISDKQINATLNKVLGSTSANKKEIDFTSDLNNIHLLEAKLSDKEYHYYISLLNDHASSNCRKNNIHTENTTSYILRAMYSADAYTRAKALYTIWSL